MQLHGLLADYRLHCIGRVHRFVSTREVMFLPIYVFVDWLVYREFFFLTFFNIEIQGVFLPTFSLNSQGIMHVGVGHYQNPESFQFTLQRSAAVNRRSQ